MMRGRRPDSPDIKRKKLELEALKGWPGRRKPANWREIEARAKAANPQAFAQRASEDDRGDS